MRSFSAYFKEVRSLFTVLLPVDKGNHVVMQTCGELVAGPSW